MATNAYAEGLGPGAIRVWVASVAEHQDLLGSGQEALSPSSKVRVGRLGTPARVAEFVLARQLLVHALKRLTGAHLPLAAIDDAGPCPRLPADAGWHASVSHSGGEVAVGLASAPVGIDLEVYDPERELLPLATRLFQPGELNWVKHARSPKALRQRFHRLWTGREAAYKAGLLDPVTAPPAWVSGGEWQPPWGVLCRMTPRFALSAVSAGAAELSVVRARLRGVSLSADEVPEPEW